MENIVSLLQRFAVKALVAVVQRYRLTFGGHLDLRVILRQRRLLTEHILHTAAGQR